MANRGSGDSRRGFDKEEESRGLGSQGRGSSENSGQSEDFGRQGLTGQGSGSEESWRPGQSRGNSEVRSQGYGAQDGKEPRSERSPGTQEYGSQGSGSSSSRGSYGFGSSGQSSYGQGRESQGGESGFGSYGPSESGGQGRQGYAGSYGYGRDQQQYGSMIPGRGRFTGKGPKGYSRSDDRIKEDVSDRLEQHGDIDASNIEVRVQQGEVTLEGTVEDRQTKRMAEDLVEECSGVKEVHNHLRIQRGNAGESTDGFNREVSSSSSEGSPSSQGSRAGMDSSGSEREKRGVSGKSSNKS